ncbi:hypothetical protein JCM5353_004708 [Sporobolomyces roseus]
MATPSQEPLLFEFSPGRASVVATGLSSLSALVAIGFLVMLTFKLSMTGGDIVLLYITIGALATTLCSGIVVTYARFQPPQATRLWSFAGFVVGFLVILWLLLCALSFAVSSNVLFPNISCSSDDLDCDNNLVSLSFKTFLAISAAILLSLILHFLLSYNLQRHLPLARSLHQNASPDLERFPSQGYRQVLFIQPAYLAIAQTPPSYLQGKLSPSLSPGKKHRTTKRHSDSDASSGSHSSKDRPNRPGRLSKRQGHAPHGHVDTRQPRGHSETKEKATTRNVEETMATTNANLLGSTQTTS